MKIPFDIKFRPQIESGEYKVENRAGQSVRIICWDKKSEKKYGYHIVALIKYGPQHEESASFTIDGKSRLEDKEPELFIITPEPELSEFEKGYMRIVHKMKPEDFNDKGLKIAKEEAAELLKLAKNEIYSHESLVKFAKTAKDEGKAEALNTLPRWIDDGLPKGSGAIDISGLCGFDFIRRNGKLLQISVLEKLPDFNE